MPFGRYDDFQRVSTPLEPMTAVLAWVRGLRSIDFVADLLVSKHGFARAASTREAARAIAAHADLGVTLIEQALGGPPSAGYLSAYYGLLDFAKVIAICAGKLARLRTEKTHGVTWSGINTAAQDLLTDKITLKPRGAIALVYESITGGSWSSRSQRGRQVTLRDVYPYIKCIAHEYGQLYSLKARLAPIVSEPQRLGSEGTRVRIEFLAAEAPPKEDARSFKLLSGLTRGDDGAYVTQAVPEGTAASETRRLLGRMVPRRYLFYPAKSRLPLGAFALLNGFHSARPYVEIFSYYTPISKSALLLPEELPLLLAFFHLGNVVRYDPVRLARLRDSRASALIEVLLREGIFEFLVLTWSFVNRTEFSFN